MTHPKSRIFHIPLLMIGTIITMIVLGGVQASGASRRSDRIVVWDGEKVTKGGTWTNPKTATFGPKIGDAHSGDTAMEFRFHESHIWIGCGFDWFDWKTGKDVGTDTRKMKNLTFWIKSKGATGDLQVQLLCNGDVVDTPEHHAAKVRVQKYCPKMLDGKWHEVVIPLVDMTQPEGYDPKVVTMIDFGFMAEKEANGSFLIDDFAFDNRVVTRTGGTK